MHIAGDHGILAKELQREDVSFARKKRKDDPSKSCVVENLFYSHYACDNFCVDG